MTTSSDVSGMKFLSSVAIGIAVVSLLGRSTLDSWNYDLRQQELRERFNATIIEGFLEDDDPELLAKVKNDSLWEACDTITLERDMRFWYYPQNEPNNLFEELTQRTYKDTPYWDQAISYEYWCNIMEYPTKQVWPWHTDRDEDVLEQEKSLVFPLMGAVYYGSTHPYEGGDFQMVDSIPYKNHGNNAAINAGDECGPEFCISNPHLLRDGLDEAMYVKTKFDTLLYVNVTHFHRVTKLKAGRRYALAMNANHWLPYKVERAPTNDGMMEMARLVRESN